MPNLLMQVEQRLQKSLNISDIRLVDDSAQHQGHASAPGHAASHISLFLVSPDFQHKTALERHRMIYAALGDLIASGDIHALRIEAKTPDEVA